MADQDRALTVPRRLFLAVAGVFAASLTPGCRSRRNPGAPAAAPAGYLDHHGWMLTPADKQKLAGRQPPPSETP